jgi:hypothetical protein
MQSRPACFAFNKAPSALVMASKAVWEWAGKSTMLTEAVA